MNKTDLYNLIKSPENKSGYYSKEKTIKNRKIIGLVFRNAWVRCSSHRTGTIKKASLNEAFFVVNGFLQ